MARRWYLLLGGPLNGHLAELDPLEDGQVALVAGGGELRCAYAYWTHLQSRLHAHPTLAFTSVLTEPTDRGVAAEG